MTATTATATAPKFVLTTDEDEVFTYSRKIDAVRRMDALEDEGITARLVSPKGIVLFDTIEADEDEVELEDGEVECPECGEAKQETAFPTVPAKKGEAAGSRNFNECRACRNDRLASGGHKIPQVCTIACRQSTHAADDDHTATCQCVCGGAFHGTEAPAAVAA